MSNQETLQRVSIRLVLVSAEQVRCIHQRCPAEREHGCQVHRRADHHERNQMKQSVREHVLGVDADGGHRPHHEHATE